MQDDNVLTPPNSSKLRAVKPHIAMDNEDEPPHIHVVAHRTTAVRRPDAPPRNEQGEIYCAHERCEDAPPTFRRACEWNKHMDRHERPYKCEHPNCLNSQGFTYSGGLLRHQREVHRMHQSATKARIFCPFPDCPRSGEGFSRKENLEEHKRRRHADQKTPVSTDDDDQRLPRKRRRPPTPVPSEYSAKADPLDTDEHVVGLMNVTLANSTSPSVSAASIDNDHPVIRALRAELQQTQEQLQHVYRENQLLRGQVQQYHNVLQNFSAPQIYNVGSGPQPGSHHQGGLLSPQAANQQFMGNTGNMMHNPHLGSMGGSAYKK